MLHFYDTICVIKRPHIVLIECCFVIFVTIIARANFMVSFDEWFCSKRNALQAGSLCGQAKMINAIR